MAKCPQCQGYVVHERGVPGESGTPHVHFMRLDAIRSKFSKGTTEVFSTE